MGKGAPDGRGAFFIDPMTVPVPRNSGLVGRPFSGPVGRGMGCGGAPGGRSGPAGNPGRAGPGGHPRGRALGSVGKDRPAALPPSPALYAAGPGGYGSGTGPDRGGLDPGGAGSVGGPHQSGRRPRGGQYGPGPAYRPAGPSGPWKPGGRAAEAGAFVPWGYEELVQRTLRPFPGSAGSGPTTGAVLPFGARDVSPRGRGRGLSGGNPGGKAAPGNRGWK